uniref:Uncharacterized protein n=1 Tax=Magallana gigas TaxID=29159 RepID=A0A8W8MIG1_MAGGI|nr:uncharacterized protein LOC105322507 [Crassostrea gigas]
MSELDFSATDDESLHLQIDETMETETDESLETGKRDAFRSITSDSDSESILTKKPSASLRRSPRKKSQKATQRSVLMPNSETDNDTTKEITTSTPLRRSPRKRRQETRRLAIACAQEDTESEDETYLSAATNMQKEKTVKSKKSKTQSGQSERLSSLNSSKSSGKNQGLHGHIKEILQNQREILSHLGVLTKELKGLRTDIDNKRDEVKEPVSVPNRIRNAVKEYFANGEVIELKWDYKKRFYDEVNSEFTDYIKRSVKGVAPDVTNEVLDTAVKRYFTSKKEAANRKSRNKETLHKQRQATYERKKEKVRRRIQAAEKKNWTTEKKNMVLGVLKSKDSHKLMSSDEEADEGFISHPYSWESDAWRNIKQSLDKKYQETCSSRSRRLLQKRQIGSVREQEKPKLKEEFSWMFN